MEAKSYIPISLLKQNFPKMIGNLCSNCRQNCTLHVECQTVDTGKDKKFIVCSTHGFFLSTNTKYSVSIVLKQRLKVSCLCILKMICMDILYVCRQKRINKYRWLTKLGRSGIGKGLSDYNGLLGYINLSKCIVTNVLLTIYQY